MRKILFILFVISLIFFVFSYNKSYAAPAPVLTRVLCTTEILPTTLQEGKKVNSIKFSNLPSSVGPAYYIALQSTNTTGKCPEDPSSTAKESLRNGCKSAQDNSASDSITFTGDKLGTIENNIKADSYNMYLCEPGSGFGSGIQCQPVCTKPITVNTSSGNEPEPLPEGPGEGDSCTIDDQSSRNACESGYHIQGTCAENFYCNAILNSCTQGTCTNLQLPSQKCFTCPEGSTWDSNKEKCIKNDSTNEAAAEWKYCEQNIQCVQGKGCVDKTEFEARPPRCDEAFRESGRCDWINVADITGNVQTTVGGFIKLLLSVVLSLSGGIAVILIIISGYKLMVSRGNPEQVQNAREQLTAAIVGLLFVIFSLVILEVIGKNILSLPGFG